MSCEWRKKLVHDVELDSDQDLGPVPISQSVFKIFRKMSRSNDSMSSILTPVVTNKAITPPPALDPACRPSLSTIKAGIITPAGSARSSRKVSFKFRNSTSSHGSGSTISDDDTVCETIASDTVSLRSRCAFNLRRNRRQSTFSATERRVFPHPEAMKEKVRMTLCKKENTLSELYHSSGFWRYIAIHPRFEQVTLSVIAFNAMWIAVETELNDETLLMKSPIVFQLMEHFFCLYFLFEWFVRFMAFRTKKHCLQDRWFCFDSGLLVLMILETWAMNLFIALTGEGLDGGMGDASILRLVRLVRILRMARMAKLVQCMPELMILVKGMAVATRTVLYTLFLLMIIVYVFSIAFMQLTKGTEMQELYFESVLGSMSLLLMEGILPDQAAFMKRMADEHILLAVALLLFILLGSLTVMNMLVGVLVEVVKNVSDIEREQMDVAFLKNHLLKYVTALDTDNDCHISKSEFVGMLENPEPLKALQNIGVDVVGLVDFTDYIFEENQTISLRKFMDMVLQLRGTNTTTVKDIVDLRKYLSLELNKIEQLLMRGGCFMPNLAAQPHQRHD